MAHCKYCHVYYENTMRLVEHETECFYATQRVSSIPTAEDKAFEVIECKQKECEKHPLLNPDSKHYQMIGGVEAISLMELMFSTEELMAWAKLTSMKYRLRIGNKDNVTKEAEKIKTYEAYYDYLESKC